MPNFRGKRFTNAHETLIWATKNPKQQYTFNYEAMKALNDELQMRSDWTLPICAGHERIKGADGQKAHSTQKPESLLHRVIVASTKPGDVILDPFFGSGTTGAVAKRLGRHFIGIEREKTYADVARARIAEIRPADQDALEVTKIQALRAAHSLRLGGGARVAAAWHRAARHPQAPESQGARRRHSGLRRRHRLDPSIGAHVQGLDACNGWTFWQFETPGGRWCRSTCCVSACGRNWSDNNGPPSSPCSTILRITVGSATSRSFSNAIHCPLYFGRLAISAK